MKTRESLQYEADMERRAHMSKFSREERLAAEHKAASQDRNDDPKDRVEQHLTTLYHRSMNRRIELNIPTMSYSAWLDKLL